MYCAIEMKASLGNDVRVIFASELLVEGHERFLIVANVAFKLWTNFRQNRDSEAKNIRLGTSPNTARTLDACPIARHINAPLLQCLYHPVEDQKRLTSDIVYVRRVRPVSQ